MNNSPYEDLLMPATDVEHQHTIIADRYYPGTCPLCKGKVISTAYSFHTFSVLCCGGCQNSWRSDMYSREKIEKIYLGESYANDKYFADKLSDASHRSTRRLKDYDRALRYIEQVAGTGRLLDVGCGAGAFLTLAKKRGWDVSGIEMSPKLVSMCQHTLKVPVTNERFEDCQLPQAAYDVVTMWDVIEHVLDPVACVRKAKELLRPGGILVFCTPDEDSLLARSGQALYKLTASRYSYPAFALHPPYHTYFFSRKGFLRILSQLDLRILKCYSQEAFFEHSNLASPLQKLAIALIEKAGGLVDRRYEMVLFARVDR